MKYTTSKSKTAMHYQIMSQPESSAVQNAISIAPPDYGIDFVDSDPAVAASQPQISGSSIQAKLTVGPVNDKYEQEADQVARQVVKQLSVPGVRPIQRQPLEEEEELMQGKFLQRQEMPEEEELMMKPDIRHVGREGGDVDSEMEATIQQVRGAGQPLPKSVRTPMEQAFGTDSSRVRVHTGEKADSLTQSLQARAFTTGQDLFFNKGEYNPRSSKGQELIAHELTHVAQQKEKSSTGTESLFKTWGSAGGLTGLTLNVTFSVSGTPATSLQTIQTFCGTRRTDGLKVGTMTWTKKKKTYDAFVDGGKNSPYVTLGGNPPAHPTKPYYLTPAEVAGQVSFSKDAGTIRVFDRPGAVAMHDEANFETAIVAVNHKGSGKDKLLKAFDWGWTSKGTAPTVSKGTKIAGKRSGVKVKSGVTSLFKRIVKHDYPKYTLT